MKGNVSRRGFLQGMAGLVAFLPVFKYLTFDKVFKAPAAGKVVYPPEYLGGQVEQLNSDGFVADVLGVKKTVVYGPKTRIWKKDWKPSLPVEVGDSFDAWGQPDPQGIYTPERIYFNISNDYGAVTNLAGGPGHVAFDLKGGRHEASVIADATALLDSSDREATFDPSNPPFKEGTFVQVVSVRTRDGLIATRIMV